MIRQLLRSKTVSAVQYSPQVYLFFSKAQLINGSDLCSRPKDINLEKINTIPSEATAKTTRYINTLGLLNKIKRNIMMLTITAGVLESIKENWLCNKSKRSI